MLAAVSTSLSVVVDGRPLADDEAKPMWARFSAHMDANQGDFDGFARSAGFVSARVSVMNGTPTLTLSSTNAPPPAAAAGKKNKRRGKRRRRR